MNGTVAVLGTGIMGSAMACRLLSSSLDIRVWNCSAARLGGFHGAGAHIAESPTATVSGAEVVVTILTDGNAVREVMIEAGKLAAMAESAIWIQCSTVGTSDVEDFATEAAQASITFVDAPVLGTKEPAERGELVVLASGPEAAAEPCAAVFDVVGQRTIWASPAGAGIRLKLVINGWLVGLVVALAEAIALARALGVDPESFLDAIDGTAVNSPYAQIKGRGMISGGLPAQLPTAAGAQRPEAGDRGCWPPRARGPACDDGSQANRQGDRRRVGRREHIGRLRSSALRRRR